MSKKTDFQPYQLYALADKLAERLAKDGHEVDTAPLSGNPPQNDREHYCLCVYDAAHEKYGNYVDDGQGGFDLICNDADVLELKVEVDKYMDSITPSTAEMLEIIEYNKKVRNQERHGMETIPDEDESVTCLTCRKKIKIDDHGSLDHAGYVSIEFGYGSRHDQGKGFGGSRIHSENPDAKEKLLACDEIRGYICDDCFEDNVPFLKGYVKEGRVEWNRKV